MTDSNPTETIDRIGLIAGNGRFPILFAREARARNVRVTAVAHRGESLEAIADEVEDLTWIRVGQLSKMIRTFRRAGVRKVVMAGGINKVRSLTALRPDWRCVKLLGRVAGRGDDALLRGLAEELEREGLTIIPSTTFLDRIVVQPGLIAGPWPDDRARDDIRLGCRVLAATGALDLGQGVVVENGVVLAVEAVEGTDEAVRRGGRLGGGRAVVVKAAKPNQDMRFDVPAVGARTLEVMAESGAKVLAVEAGAGIVLDGEAVDVLARRHAISFVGCTHTGEVPRD